MTHMEINAAMANQPSRSNLYHDIDMKFELNEVTKDIILIKDADAIAQSINNMLMNVRLWTFKGKPLNRFIFESFYSEVDNMIIIHELEEMILEKEPRISDIKITAVKKISEQIMEVDVTFTPKTTNEGVSYSTKIYKVVSN